MFVYSGDCRLGTVGDVTPFSDMFGNALFVGDIVITLTDNHMTGQLTAVVSDEFTSYSNGTHKIKEGPVEPFVMGIKSVDLATPGTWSVMKLKDHSDVISGEHWQAYGFNFRNE